LIDYADEQMGGVMGMIASTGTEATPFSAAV
jgi:hypothetical protein